MRLLWPWRVIPADARMVILVALLMPLIINCYHLAPWVAAQLAIEDAHAVARAMFSLSFAGGCFLVGQLISAGCDLSLQLSDRRRDWQIFVGHAVGAAGITAALMAVVSLKAPLLTGADQGMTWRALTGLSQGVLLVGWTILWRVRLRWLSQTTAGLGALAMGAGMALFIVANFLVVDPLTASWGWGVIHPQSIVARVTGQPWLEPLIAVALWIALARQLRRWWRAQADGCGT